MTFYIQRIYDSSSPLQGVRVLVDRVWPRGVSKEKANLALWMKEAAPSTELRKWFNHDPAKWTEFKERYFKELDSLPGVVKTLQNLAKKQPVILLYSAKDEQHNQALALKQYLTATS